MLKYFPFHLIIHMLWNPLMMVPFGGLIKGLPKRDSRLKFHFQQKVVRIGFFRALVLAYNLCLKKQSTKGLKTVASTL